MDKKSKFLSPLLTRDGLNYPKPGSWMRNVSFNKLATLAKNLDTSKSKNHPDKLHSIPTPWARLLLFESALYDKDHPAHAEVTSQWRGLLGLIGLADVLGLGKKLSVPPFSLRAEPTGDLKNAFAVLKPQHVVAGKDQEDGKWSEFGLIYFDGALLGGTSPRTLVFTGISHQCPANVPFRSPQGRLADPGEYYKTHDTKYLHVIKQWLDYTIETIAGNSELSIWLGNRPSDPNAQPESRHRQMLDALEEWRSSLGSNTTGAVVVPAGFSRLPAPYDFLRHIERIENGSGEESDLFLRGHKDVVVCYRPEDNSVILDAFDNPVTGQPLRIFSSQLVQPGQSLPRKLDFLPANVKAITNPIDLFEDTLIEIEVIDSRAAFCLSLGKKNYLLPFRRSITEYFTELEAAEVMRNARVSQPDGATIRVEVTIPLVKGRKIRVHKDYKQDQNIISNDHVDLLTQELAMWPDFICPGEDRNGKPFFEHYFYYTNDQPKGSNRVQVEFKPPSDNLITRDLPEKGKRWYLSKTPLPWFVGSVNDKEGLLLINHRVVAPPTTDWKVGVDFGSTHTSIFRREVEFRDGKWVGLKESTVEPVSLVPRVRILTVGDEAQIQETFFLYKAGSAGLVLEPIITTQLSLPTNEAKYYPDSWLPREGQVFLGSLLETIPNSSLLTDLKWNIDQNNYATSSFLRSLLVMVEAEVIQSGARLAHVSHSYPTAFPAELREKHKQGWTAVNRTVNVPVDPVPLSEAVAVCRHLWADQKALPMANVVALDIGGSTTDIAVWSSGALQIQESVKMAAGSAMKFIEAPPAQGYREWFIEKMNSDEPFVRSGIRLQQDKLKRRVYQAALKRLSEDGAMESFIETVKASPKKQVREFLSPIVFLFAAISYFAGLLTRKAGMDEHGEYYLFFCGRGGQLIRWMQGGEALVQEMFRAGLWLPTPPTSLSGVNIKVSEFPKQEVGRGLLIEKNLDAAQHEQTVEVFAEAGPTVTVAEDGFPGLAWNDNLTYEKLKQIRHNIPPTEHLAQLNHFVDTFSSSALTKAVSDRYGMKNLSSGKRFQDRLMQRLSDNLQGGEDRALIEPLFITETKILIELMTGQDGLFD
jgi:hypothetical protein